MNRSVELIVFYCLPLYDISEAVYFNYVPDVRRKGSHFHREIRDLCGQILLFCFNSTCDVMTEYCSLYTR